MSENVFSTYQFPLGIATNFLINNQDCLIPMAIEEPSVVAAASKAAKIAREAGGFSASSDEPVMIGQIQIVNLKNAEEAKKKILENKNQLIKIANEQDPILVQFGGGVRDFEAKVFETRRGKMLVVYLSADVRDAAGMNAVNTMCEALSPYLEDISEGEVRLRIISNLATKRLARAKAVFSKKALEESFAEKKFTGEEIVERMLDAYEFAYCDPYRATTHNKGIMNGIDAVAIACGQDFRALEAGAHSFASISGKYLPLTKYYKNSEGSLVGEIELPIAVGLVGGAARTHPIARICLKILGVKSAQQLAEVMACVGLANNFAALRALAMEGIQLGHMRLHAKNIAVLAGAEGNEIDEIAEKMVAAKKIRVDYAKELLEKSKK
ncbi:hydroxymethylglutaryl-CoA reductase, degradative, partial [Candidatus Micrarchaeota archaeon]|nr:hydroxymethylglutaryl-CoA reductase, degradative [Candidatus Micrarchaeota archaeon]